MSNNSSANSACRIHFSASIASHVSSIVSRTWLVTTTKVVSVTQILRSFAEFAHLGYSTAKDTDGDPITTPIELKDCNGDSDQEFDGFQSNGGFELRPQNRGDRCLGTNHHPKSSEKVHPKSCSQGRGDTTSEWETY